MKEIMNNTAAIVLAAGKGTRIGANDRNKVAYEIGDKPMIAHTVTNLQDSGVKQIIAVIGYESDSVKAILSEGVDFAVQDPPQGTGDAVKVGVSKLDSDIVTVLAISGDDSAFYPSDTYLDIVKSREIEDTDIVFLTISKDNPTGLGRIVRDQQDNVQKIVEEKNATEDEKKIKEINTGLYCFKRSFLEDNITEISKNPVTQEYYLTDLIEIAIKNNGSVKALRLEDNSIWHGINTQEELSSARDKFAKLKSNQDAE